MNRPKPGWDAQTKATVLSVVAAIASAIVGFSLRGNTVAAQPEFISSTVAAASLCTFGVFLVRAGLSAPDDEYEFYEANRNRRSAIAMVIGGSALVIGPILWLTLWLALS